MAYGDEVKVPTVNGEFLCFETSSNNPSGCSYIRFVDEGGEELAYWDFAEWVEDPQLVMGAIMGSIQNGATTLGA